MSRQYNRFVAGSCTSAIVAFLDEIGLPVIFCDISGATFLPGIRIERGRLLVDKRGCSIRAICCTKLDTLRCFPRTGAPLSLAKPATTQVTEMGAIAWSYAVALHIGIEPAVVFHGDGYRGSSQAIMENFAAGRYIGVPISKWLGLTVSSSGGGALGVRTYPHMVKWLVE